MSERTMASGQVPLRDRAALVGLVHAGLTREAAEASLEELVGLCETAGLDVALRAIQQRPRPDPATFIGAGKVEALRRAADELAIDVVVFDNELSPAQLRNLERTLDRRILDRTQVILDIFAQRARTREGKLQVELAQLEYLMPRLVGAGAWLSRLGGGIGTRGPGETKLETDRRRLRHRIAALSRELREVRRRRGYLRDRRRTTATPAVALVGYTNAGKTTLFNRLTREQAAASDALFVTLDPLVRQVRLRGGGVFHLSDTVGFISRLPHTLVAAFRATLEEVVEADLLLHVADASHPELERQVEAVHAVLAEVGAARIDRVLVLNKVDLLGADDRERLQGRYPGSVLVSARSGEGVAMLLDHVARRLGLDARVYTLELDQDQSADAARLATLYRHGRVLRLHQEASRVTIEVELSRRLADRLFAPAAGHDHPVPS